jgi:Protein of unknown function (DUF3500)
MKSAFGAVGAILLVGRLLAGPGSDMAAAAHNLLATLNDEQKAKASFPFIADERKNWHFIPKDRKGIPMGELTPEQRYLAHALLSSAMSQRGYGQAVTIMSLEQILRDLEGPKRTFPRDPNLYYVTVFGEPGESGEWGWRVEGHHLSVNFTVSNGEVIGDTPNFMGTNPAQVKSGPRAGLRVLGAEEDLARDLIHSLTPDQQKLAITSEKAPDDIATAAARKVEPGAASGLAYSELDKKQKALANRLILQYLQRLRPELAAPDWSRIQKAGIDKVHFAWMGGLEKGQRHYYRVQGPTFLLEYDNTQNDANHIHAVWRDLERDFGGDPLAIHYKEAHKNNREE